MSCIKLSRSVLQSLLQTKFISTKRIHQKSCWDCQNNVQVACEATSHEGEGGGGTTCRTRFQKSDANKNILLSVILVGQ